MIIKDITWWYYPKYGYLDIYDYESDESDYVCDILGKPTEYTEETLFHVGGSENPAKTLKCPVCGAVEFNIGKCYYWTGARCIKCGVEFCVHGG